MRSDCLLFGCLEYGDKFRLVLHFREIMAGFYEHARDKNVKILEIILTVVALKITAVTGKGVFDVQ